MSDDLAGWLDWLRAHPELQTLLASATLIFAAWLSNWIVKRILVRGLYRLLRHTRDGELQDFGIIKRLSNIVPALVLSLGVTTVPGLPEAAVTVVQNVCGGFIVLTIALALGAVLDIINVVYQRRPDARLHPIKGYLQVVKIVIYAIATILIIATLIDRSPLILLSGLGAMAAVLMLIFQDTLLSLVASVQITSNDLIRVGDWVEMPQLNADGDVIDIALHTVKVQNWDKTVTTIPTYKLFSESYRNWRQMFESGGRRIKRTLSIDASSVRFLTPSEVDSLSRFALLRDYLNEKKEDLERSNQELSRAGMDAVNYRRLTNLGTFRAYCMAYIKRHAEIHQDMIQMVRMMEPTAEGIPVEVYCFTNKTAWVDHERIQGDIFDHFLAVLPEIGLRLFQSPTGQDLSLGLSLAAESHRSLRDSGKESLSI